MLFVIQPFPVVILPIMPSKFTLPTSHTIFELALVYTFVCQLRPIAFVVLLKHTLEVGFLSDVDSLSTSHSLPLLPRDDLPQVKGIFKA